ncbi:type VI secretion system lipoprotein TssJ [Pseudomonas sp. Irchel 3F5]|uniref:type VI secretion system lipoprotein TssJ n=1 Tax=Pseudomonas sp. Irchel 3F5 TaxID=2009002 RepID=UPI000BA4C3C3|nr:type VI secretion system lipoprotein TssJ [Pseudomonas sp. Irchel 3F5]
MNLTLVIGNPAQLLHGCLPSRRMDYSGGLIGSYGCDWLLRDRSGRVRPQHCRIHWHEGRFCVTDLCDGTYLNGHDLPLGRGATVRLNEGDVLQVGAYRIVVHLQADACADDDPRHLSQRSLAELLSGHEDGLEDWCANTRTMETAPVPAPALCAEFERLCRPLDPREQHDPLLALATLPSMPSTAAHGQLAQNHHRPLVARRSKKSLQAGTLPLCLLLLAALALGGCTLLGKLGQVIIDPSTPVGGPDDQPSRYSLSLHASDDVNRRLVTPGTALMAGEQPALAPYSLDIKASSPQALADKLQAVLEHLYENAPGQSPVSDALAPEPQVSWIDESPLGDYQAAGVHLATAAQHTAPQQIATPVAFRVLQLSDDSLLMTASAEALALDLKTALGSTYLRVDDYLLRPGQFKFVDLQPVDERARFIAVIADYHNEDVSQWKQLLRVEPKGRRYALLVELGQAQVALKGETR